MFSVINDLTKTIVELIDKSNKIEVQDRQKLSLIFEEISKVLMDTSEMLKNDIYPHNNCMFLEMMSNDIHLIMKKYVSEERANFLLKKLIESSQIEREYHLRKEAETIPNIEESAGAFKAMSLLIK